MADTITSYLKAATGNSQRGRNPYYVENTIDLTAVAIDSSDGDIVQAITIPANTKIMAAGFQVVESATLDSGTDATATLGAADADEYVTAFDIDGAADGAYAPSATVAADVVLATADTLDLTFASAAGTEFTAGNIRVYAVMMDVSEAGDISANEVDRDTLA